MVREGHSSTVPQLHLHVLPLLLPVCTPNIACSLHDHAPHTEPAAPLRPCCNVIGKEIAGSRISLHPAPLPSPLPMAAKLKVLHEEVNLPPSSSLQVRMRMVQPAGATGKKGRSVH